LLTRCEDKRFFPKELHSAIGADDTALDADGRPVKRQRKLGLVKASVSDRLAKFDEGAEDVNANADSENEDDEPEEGEDEDRDLDREADEVDFEDDDDDYNAEQYFDGGEEDYDEGGGDGGGEDIY
jgi:DNA-directed RNA polymerase III subunit RPC7